jgi:pimeloyl-ACP methyl ester carboxylesterase
MSVDDKPAPTRVTSKVTRPFLKRPQKYLLLLSTVVLLTVVSTPSATVAVSTSVPSASSATTTPSLGVSFAQKVTPKKVVTRTRKKTKPPVKKKLVKKKTATTTTTTTTPPTTTTTTTVVAQPVPAVIAPVNAAGADTTTTTALAPVTTAVAAPTAPLIATAVFAACPDSELECARINVPSDYANPSGPQVSLFVSRRRATDPANRLGVLLVNPGGPGGPAYDTIRSSAQFLTPEVRARFDVIGVDPRGTQRSAPLVCDSSRAIRIGDIDGVARSCAITDGAQLQVMDTETAARDMESVRVALGEERISYLGMSYGTYLGAVYRQLFSNRVGSMILDSAIDPTRFGENMLVDPVVATEKALDGFLDECSSGRLNPCLFNDGTDLRAKYLQVRKSFIDGFSRSAAASATRRFDGQVAELVGYPRNGWPILGRALQEVATTGSGNFRRIPTDSQSSDIGEEIELLDSFSTATNLAINCRDGILPRGAEADKAVRAEIGSVAPRFAGVAISRAVSADTCVNWSAPLIPLLPLTAQPQSPTLIIGNTFDLTTPYRWSEGLSASLAAPLLTRNGGGHVAVTKSACVQEAVARFLIDKTAPAPGTICSPSLSNPS